ncbi:hypothetical protein LJB76_01710 [Clostridia bacterium OttesenSCG-928-O13]|nr:hypothetical protein [Clostridia bacterium OttesenSCG-928-O13]
MQTIVLVMRRRPVAQGLMLRLEAEPGLTAIFEPDYANADVAIRSHGAGITLIEACESGDYDTSHCLVLCARLRKKTPGCKLLLMCPEQDKGSVSQAVQAKRDGCIDDFVFYDSTTDYLTSKLLSM